MLRRPISMRELDTERLCIVLYKRTPLRGSRAHAVDALRRRDRRAGPKIRDTNINDIPYPYPGSFSAVSKPIFATKY